MVFFSLEKDARLITLEEELQQLRGQVEKMKAKSEVSVYVEQLQRKFNLCTECHGKGGAE